MKVELCTRCRRNNTAEGVCVPCRQARDEGLAGGYFVAPILPHPVGAVSSQYFPPVAARAAVAAGERRRRSPETPPEPEMAPHNLDAAEGLERPVGATLAVLTALSDFSFLTPHCFPSEDTIAERAGVDRRTVVRAKRWLRDNGWISWTRVWGSGRWQHCAYTILAGWCRPLRKTVLAWLDKRRCRANVSLRELPPTHVEKETQRSKPRRVRNGWSPPWQGWMRPKPPAAQVNEDEIQRAGSRRACRGFATWTPYAVA